MSTESIKNIDVLVSSIISTQCDLTKLISLFAKRNIIRVSPGEFNTLCRNILNLKFTFTEFGEDLQKKLVGHNVYSHIDHIKFIHNGKKYIIQKHQLKL